MSTSRRRPGGVYAEVWDYDARADQWREMGLMPVPRHGLGAVAVDERIYVIGGATAPSGNGTSAAGVGVLALVRAAMRVVAPRERTRRRDETE